MKSYNLKILLLLLTLTLASCLPDSTTKFKKDPPKRKAGAVAGVILPDLHATNGFFCDNGNGSATVEAAGEDLILGGAPINAPFNSGVFLTTPFSLNGSDDPNYEFSVIGDQSTVITNLMGAPGVSCSFADNSSTPIFNDTTLAAKLSITIAPPLPTGLTAQGSTDNTLLISGSMDGFNELAAYRLTVTNSTTGTSADDSIEIASSRNLLDSSGNPNFYYTQYENTLWAMQVSDATNFLPNHAVINSSGAKALINHIDYIKNVLYLSITTTAGEEYQKFFKVSDSIDMVLPVGTPSFLNSDATVVELYATLLTGTDIEGVGTNNFALHFTDSSGFVTPSSNDGLTPADTELTEWIRCTHSPNTSGPGSINFLDGQVAQINTMSDITNWGLDGTTVAGDNEAIGTLDRICEFNGQFSNPLPKTTIATKIISYSGQEATASVAFQAKDTVAQPYAITNPYSADPDKAFYFHYRYSGSSTDLATLIITVESSSSFSYNSTTPDQNKISNGRGTAGTITYIDGNKLYVTLDTNDAYAFVTGDLVDNTGTFLSSESNISNIEYTFQVGKTADPTTLFTPQIALLRAFDRLDINAAGLVLTPFGKSQFSNDFLKQIRIGGSISILNDNNVIESQIIASIELAPGSHSVTVTAAFAGGIPNDVNRLVYTVPLGTTELGTLTYSIDSYLGISTGAISGLVLMGTLTQGEVVFKPGSFDADPEHGSIVIANNISAALDTQSFTVSATDLEGNTATTNFNFSAAAPPANLSMNRNLLINVPSGSAFSVGSYVSSSNADRGLGVVKDIILATESSGYFYLDIQLVHGTFEEFDDLDNVSLFDSQKTYILGDGIIKYNAAVELASIAAAQNFADKLKCTTNNKYNRFIDTSIASFEDGTTTADHLKGAIAYQWDNFLGTNSQLKSGASNRVYLQVEQGSLSTADSLRPSNCTDGEFNLGTFPISEVLADNIILTHDPVAANVFVAGLNITSRDGPLAADNRGAGVVHSIASTESTYVGQYYHANNGNFYTNHTIDNINPYVGTEETITDITFDHTFYLYRYEKASIEFNLGVGRNADGTIPADTKIEFLEYDGNGYCSAGNLLAGCPGLADCSDRTTRTACESGASGQLDEIQWVPTEIASAPLGLTFDTSTGKIFGTPVINAAKEKFVLKVSNPYGVVSHTFELKVYDHFLIAPTDTIASPKPDTYLMHQLGFGMANVPCRVTQEAMNTATSTVPHPNAADVVDITCLMDGGESDLYHGGLEITVKTGDDMCTVVQHTPFYYYDWPYFKTTNAAGTLYKNSGDYEDVLCGKQPEFTLDTVATEAFIPATPGAAPNLSVATGVSTPADICFSDFPPIGALTGGGNLTPTGPNCDDGKATYQVVSWAAQEFICMGDNGEDSTSQNPNQCSANNGSCSGGTPGSCAASCNSDCGSCATSNECTAGDWSWTPSYTHNDPSVPANYDSTLADYGCQPTLEAIQADPCGGAKGQCVGGVGAFNQGLSLEELGEGEVIATSMVGITSTQYSYNSPMSLGHNSNLAIANYMNRTSCDAETYDFDWTTVGPANDWIDYSTANPLNANHPFAGGYNYYGYTCDGGSGPIARVRMFVREWDNTFDITSGIEGISIGVYGAPPHNRMDDPSGETDFCGIFAPCNNYADWDDSYINNSSCGDQDLLFNFTSPPFSGFPKETN